MRNESNQLPDSSDETRQLVARFKEMEENRKSVYFDSEELISIAEFYAYNNQPEESSKVLEYALKDKIDVAVLIISDTDYVPLLRKLNSLGIRTILLSWEFEYVNDDGVRMVTKTSHELLQMANYPIAMHTIIEEGLDNDDENVISLFVDSEPASREENDYNSETGEPIIERSEILSIKSGFGFVKYPNNNLYFHSMDVIGDFYDLMPGDPVEFTIEKNAQRQDVAKNVRKL